MKVILLAAGVSKRLSPLSDKNFLSLCGKALIEHQVELLFKVGFSEVLIIGGEHNIAKFSRIFGDKITILQQKDLSLGMAGAVLTAEPYLNNEPIVVVSSNDILSESAFLQVLEASKDSSLDGAILGYQVEKYFPGGYLSVNDTGLISSIIEKPTPGEEPSNLINLVVHYHKNSTDLFKALSTVKSNRDDLYEVALDQIFKAGKRYKALQYQDYWQAIKYPWHIKDAWKRVFSSLEKKISSSAQIHKSAIIEGEVIIEDDVKVFPNAVIIGPAFIGKGSIIANNALVRDSHLGSDCVAGYNTEIARSYLASEVWTHSNYIGDSIIGKNVSFGAGTITANLRLDEEDISVNISGEKISTNSNKMGIICADHVRVGVSVNLMPGIKIGTNVMIGSGLVISEDISAHSFVTGKTDLNIRPNRMSIDNLSRDRLMEQLKKNK